MIIGWKREYPFIYTGTFYNRLFSLSSQQQSKQHAREAPGPLSSPSSAPSPTCPHWGSSLLPPASKPHGFAHLLPLPSALHSSSSHQYVCVACCSASTSSSHLKHSAGPWTPSWECLLRYQSLIQSPLINSINKIRYYRALECDLISQWCD